MVKSRGVLNNGGVYREIIHFVSLRFCLCIMHGQRVFLTQRCNIQVGLGPMWFSLCHSPVKIQVTTGQDVSSLLATLLPSRVLSWVGIYLYIESFPSLPTASLWASELSSEGLENRSFLCLKKSESASLWIFTWVEIYFAIINFTAHEGGITKGTCNYRRSWSAHWCSQTTEYYNHVDY